MHEIKDMLPQELLLLQRRRRFLKHPDDRVTGTIAILGTVASDSRKILAGDDLYLFSEEYDTLTQEFNVD